MISKVYIAIHVYEVIYGERGCRWFRPEVIVRRWILS